MILYFLNYYICIFFGSKGNRYVAISAGEVREKKKIAMKKIDVNVEILIYHCTDTFQVW